MATTTGRIIQAAIELLQGGADPIDAIEAACASVYTSEASRERARKFYMTMLARAERS